MRKLALDDDILLSIEKPARYIGGEVNAVMKEKELEAGEIAVRFAMCFPDVYEIGMSHLGIQILYDMFNRREDVWCERVYSPWMDLDKIMREQDLPLFALESQDPVRSFDFLGITIQFEMCYTNILQILELSHIPLHSSDRTLGRCLLSLAVVHVPTILNHWLNFLICSISEREKRFTTNLLDAYKECESQWQIQNRISGTCRTDSREFMYRLFMRPNITRTALLKSFTPTNAHAPAVVRKQIVMDVTNAPYPLKPVVPFIKATQDRVVLEIQRGCIRGCRFCQAGMLYRPTRERNVDRLKEYAHAMLKNTGHEEISLSSLSSSDYSELKELVLFLIDEFKEQGINISLPSLRIDAFSLDVMSRVQDIRKSSLTFAPEAGSQRMRDVINKGLTEEVILNGAGQAFEGGWTKVKLYFMLGLPTETEDDMKEIAHLSEKVARRYYEIPKDQRHGKCQITASSSFFVPKPFTPFQWAPMCKAEEYMRRAHLVNDEFKAQLNRKSLKYNWHDAQVTVLEGVMARGDRRIGKLIEEAYRLGCLFDSWTESFHNELWMQAFENTGIDLEFYNLRERNEDELFPWDFIDIGVSRKFLRREWERAMKETVTPNCRMQCSGCGAAKFGGGVCYESKN